MEEEGVGNLRKSLVGENSFYAISITRSTEDNSEMDYKFLASPERCLIYSILHKALGTEVPEEEFKKILGLCIQNDLKKYEGILLYRSKLMTDLPLSVEETIKNQYINDLTSISKCKSFHNPNKAFIKDPEFLKELGEIVSAAIKEKKAGRSVIALKFESKINNLEEALKYIDNHYDSIRETSIKKLASEEESQFFDYWVRNESRVEDISREYIEIFKSIASQAKDKFKGLKSADGLVIFNEMFFGKSVPLNKQDIPDEISQLSTGNPNKFFVVNFLQNHEIASSDSPKYQKAPLFTPFIETAVKDYEERVKNFMGKPEARKINLLSNVNFTYLNGDVLTRYLKGSYQMEYEKGLKDADTFYLFGNGQDAVIAQKHLDLATLFSQGISTETCADIKFGVRNRYNTYPKDSKIHIVMSNSIGIAQNMHNLPLSSRVLIHVDSREKNIMYEHTEVIQAGIKNSKLYEQYCTPRWKAIQNPTHPFPTIEFEVDNSIYKIQTFDLKEKLASK